MRLQVEQRFRQRDKASTPGLNAASRIMQLADSNMVEQEVSQSLARVSVLCSSALCYPLESP